MAKQILIGIEKKELSEVAHYLMIYFPYNEEMCSYTDAWMGELYEDKYPLVAKGMWSGIINLKTHKLLNWKLEYGDLYLQAKICARYATAERIFCSIKIKRQYARLPAMCRTV